MGSVLLAWLPLRTAARGLLCAGCPHQAAHRWSGYLRLFIPSLHLIGSASVLPVAQAKLYNFVLFFVSLSVISDWSALSPGHFLSVPFLFLFW